jgi:hypothetical protein
MKYNIATTWQGLNAWQVEKIAGLYFANENQEAPGYNGLKILQYVFMQQDSFWQRLKFKRLLSQVPISTLEPYLAFVFEEPVLHQFPQINGLQKPADRLGDISIKQFSVCDALFHRWRSTKNTIFLRQLVASLYRLGPNFNPQLLADIAEITDKLSLEKQCAIGLVYWSVRNFIIKRYPKVFPPPKNQEEELKPSFSQKSNYLPFSKLITVMALDERQPLGDHKRCSNTLIYDFFEILSESIILSEKQYA